LRGSGGCTPVDGGGCMPADDGGGVRAEERNVRQESSDGYGQ